MSQPPGASPKFSGTTAGGAYAPLGGTPSISEIPLFVRQLRTPSQVNSAFSLDPQPQEASASVVQTDKYAHRGRWPPKPSVVRPR